MGKVVLIGLVAQVNVVVLRLLASLLVEGSVTQYWYAARVVDLAQGAIAVGVGTALLPVISRNAALRQWDDFREHFGEAVRLVGFVLLPAAALLLALAPAIVAVLFRHGAFDITDATRTSATLRMLVPFMLALAGINIVKKAFFALDDRTVLIVVGLLGLVFTAGLGLPLSKYLGVRGLGLALSASASAQLVLYLLLLRQRMATTLGLRSLLSPLIKMALASVPAALVAAALASQGDWSRGPASLANWGLLAGAGVSAVVLYLGVAWTLGLRPPRRP
jgi:putative peptidoglycan lipid II flippase